MVRLHRLVRAQAHIPLAAHGRLAKKLEGIGVTAHFATGEHEYTRWGYSQLIDAGVDLLQPDVMWMGGPTEFARVVGLASSRGVSVVPPTCGCAASPTAAASTATTWRWHSPPCHSPSS